MSDRRWEIDTVLEQDRYGSMIYNVLDQKLTFSTVVTVVGVNTTVDIMKMFPSLATAVSMVMYRMMLNIFLFVRELQLSDRYLMRALVISI